MSDGLIRTNDGVVLKDALAKAERRQTIKALSLVAPLGLFLLAAFLIPIALMLFRSVDNKTSYNALRNTNQALQGWEATELPSEEQLRVALNEFAALRATGTIGKVSQRLNRFYPGMDSALKKATREIQKSGGKDFKALDKLASNTYDYSDLAGRLWQFTSEHSRLSHLSRIYQAQNSALKEIDRFPTKVAPETVINASEFIAYAKTVFDLQNIPEIDKKQADALLAKVVEESKEFPQKISELELRLETELAELANLKEVLGDTNTASAGLNRIDGDDEQAKKDITLIQSQNNQVNLAQKAAGETRSAIQSHKNVLKALASFEAKIGKLITANAAFDKTFKTTSDVLKARKDFAKILGNLSQHGKTTELDSAVALVHEGKEWLGMRSVLPIDPQELQTKAFQMFGEYDYIANSKYDTYQALFLKAKEVTWSDPTSWVVVRRLSERYVADYFLRALDLKYSDEGSIVREPEHRRIFVWLLIKTILLSATVAFCCLLLGYPLAYLLATLPTKTSNLLMIFVLLPFWTSLLVRTTAWLAILSREGVVNSIYVWIQQNLVMPIFGDFEPDRFEVAYTWKATLIAMVHILLPFMILPVFSVMKNISPSFMRAGRSLGATSFTAFRRVYFPQTLPGIGAGALLVFILAIGYFITPALVGGADGVLISNMIQTAMQTN
ncbi:MAG: ABC transporter permease, partial [Alphaproteobacteria bacterium]